MIWPVPQNYTEWKEWANQLIHILKRPPEDMVGRTKKYTVATAPALELTGISDGMIIIVSDEVGGRTLATSSSGYWHRVKDGAKIA